MRHLPDSTKPIVAILGRPNVGKITIFNILTICEKAILHRDSGITRHSFTTISLRVGGAKRHDLLTK